MKDFWRMSQGTRYDLAAYGPNGFVAQQSGVVRHQAPAVTIAADQDRSLRLSFANENSPEAHVSIREEYTRVQRIETVKQGATLHVPVDLSASGGWYDLTLEVASAGDEPLAFRRYAGRVENGQHSHSDPFLSPTTTH